MSNIYSLLFRVHPFLLFLFSPAFVVLVAMPQISTIKCIESLYYMFLDSIISLFPSFTVAHWQILLFYFCIFYTFLFLYSYYLYRHLSIFFIFLPRLHLAYYSFDFCVMYIKFSLSFNHHHHHYYHHHHCDL